MPVTTRMTLHDLKFFRLQDPKLNHHFLASVGFRIYKYVYYMLYVFVDIYVRIWFITKDHSQKTLKDHFLAVFSGQLGTLSNLTNIFEMGWNHHLVFVFFFKSPLVSPWFSMPPSWTSPGGHGLMLPRAVRRKSWRWLRHIPSKTWRPKWVKKMLVGWGWIMLDRVWHPTL